MCEYVDFGGTGEPEDFIEALCDGHGIAFDRADRVLMSEIYVCTAGLKRFGNPAPVAQVFSVTEAHSVDH